MSDKVEGLIAERTVELFDRITGGDLHNGEPIWLVVDNGPYVPCATRPVEWYIAQYGFPVMAVDFDLFARVVKVLPLQAPTASQPGYLVDVQVGDAIRLIGYDTVTAKHVATFDSLHPGDMLGISLVWETIASMDLDYTTALHIVDGTGQEILQQDRPPMNGFSPTSKWKPGDRIRDNFGFVIPDDLPPGEYQLRAIIYLWPSLERLPVTGQGDVEQSDYATLGVISVE